LLIASIRSVFFSSKFNTCIFSPSFLYYIYYRDFVQLYFVRCLLFLFYFSFLLNLCLMRLKDNFKISKNCSGDSFSVISDVTVRVIEVILDNGSKEYLATNLLDPSFTPDMFRELYFYRWLVETKYKELKSRLAIEDFNGATSVSVFQEFYISMLLSNLSSLIKNEVDQKLRISSKSSNKHRYQANRSFIIGRMKVLPQILSCKASLSSIDSLFLDACWCLSQILPGRSFRRKKNKAKGRTHFRNLKASF